MSIKLGGWIPDPKDNISKKWIAPLGTFSKSIHEIPIYTPISKQRIRPSCVGNAVADLYEIIYGIKYGKDKVKQFSRRFVWVNAKAAINKAKDINSGCHIRDAMLSLTTAGICLEETFPYDVSDEECARWPTDDAYKEADSNKINEFYKIHNNEDISDAIFLNYPVVSGIVVGRDFVNFAGGIFDGESRPEGGHAIIIVGYNSDEDIYKIRNSWGEDWGDSGYAWVNGTWIRNNAIDSWVATGIKEFK